MKRIIGKVDYEMYKRGQVDPKLALDLWFKICKDKGIIKNAIEVVENEAHEKCFRAPAICHMILSNPWGIDKKIFDEFATTILNNPELNKLTVWGNQTFLYLILFNGALGFDELHLELARRGLKEKILGQPFEVRKVIYTEVSSQGEKAMSYKNEDLNVVLTDEEVKVFDSGKSFDVSSELNYDEVESLMDLVNTFPILDEKIISSINQLEQLALNEQRRINEEGTPKL